MPEYSFPGYSFSTDWLSAYAPSWLAALDKLGIPLDARRDVLEIGSFEGRSACWISDHLLDHPQSTLTCVDTFCGSEDYGTMFSAVFKYAFPQLELRCRTNIAKSANGRKVRLTVEDSEIFLVAAMCGKRKYDLCYVDGGHREEVAYSDGWQRIYQKPSGIAAAA